MNYRDLLVLGDSASIGRIPLSDGAGVIEAIGRDVTNLKVGDRVMIPFFRDWLNGPFRSSYLQSALGGDVTDGVLTDKIIVPSSTPVKIPDSLSFDVAATLPCAAVTVWAGLVERAKLSAGDTILIQGTGGVALFALQIAVAKGVRVIITSSSDEKLERAKAMGAAHGINYKKTPAWDEEVLKITDKNGVSHVLELGGPDTYQRSLNSLAGGGKIIQIGVLTGFGSRPNLWELQIRNADIIGVTVGSRLHLEKVTNFIDENRINPVIDRIFPISEPQEALEYLRSAKYFGKIVLSAG